MPNSVPNVRGTTTAALYPVTMRIQFDTFVGFNLNGTEQRWKKRAPLFTFELPYQSLLINDANPQRDFFRNQQGMFATNISLTLGGTTYSNLTLDSDDFARTTPQPLQYQTKFVLRQTQNRAYPSNGPLANFPTLANGLVTQHPIVHRYRYQTSKVDVSSGMRYSFPWYGPGAYPGFPQGSRNQWDLSWQLLQDVDTQTLINAFVGWDGRLATFTFTDPLESIAIGQCRMLNDELVVLFQDYNDTRMSMSIVDVPNG